MKFPLAGFLVAVSTFVLLTGCAADIPCSASNQCSLGCCSISGQICGYGPDYCAADKCNAAASASGSCAQKSECDPGTWGSTYAGSETCPLNVCCSAFGFCGTTSDFCGTKTVTEPSCSGKSSSSRTIGYYEGWSQDRSCDQMLPEGIPIGAYTHLNFAFAYIDPNSFAVSPMSEDQVDLYQRTTNLKELAPGLEVWISIGGWSMNDPDQPTASTFSTLAGSTDAQGKFFKSLLSFLETYGFDGIDIDWEYPVAPERSGNSVDYVNYVSFLQNLKLTLAASGHKYGLSITIPSSYWYMQNFDIVNIAKHIDWFNMMTYDLHGTWDSTDKYIGSIINAHTNLTEIDLAMQLLWRNNIDPSQVTLGLGFYGRSFTLTDPSCSSPGCAFSSGGNAGSCTQNVGTLSYSEITDVINDQSSGAVVTLNEAAAVKQVVWDTNQWVSYDDAETLGMKIAYANSHCIGGTMVWAVSLDTSTGDAAQALSNGTSAFPGTSHLTIAAEQPTPKYDASGACFITDCAAAPSCPSDYGAVQQINGNKQNVTIEHGCSKGQKRTYCCPSDDMPTCRWIGSAPSCKGSCDSGEVALTFDTGGCSSGHKSLCCKTTTSDAAVGECIWKGTAPLCYNDNACPSSNPIELGRSNTGDNQQECSFSSINNDLKRFCCQDPSPYTNCTWYTKGDQDPPPSPRPASCSGKCPQGKVLVATDNMCYFGGTRAFCCDTPSTYNDGFITNFKNNMLAFENPLSCPASQIDDYTAQQLQVGDPTQGDEKRNLEPSGSKMPAIGRRDFKTAGGYDTLLILLAALTSQTYTGNLVLEAYDDGPGAQNGFKTSDILEYISWAATETWDSVQSIMTALCQGTHASTVLQALEAEPFDLCEDASTVSAKKRRDLFDLESYSYNISAEQQLDKRIFELDNTLTGWAGNGARPYTGAIINAIISGSASVVYKYSRRIDYNFVRKKKFGGGEFPQVILEVVYDISGNPDLKEFTADAFAVFHIHVEKLVGELVGIRSIGVFHGQSVIHNTGTSDYTVYNGDQGTPRQGITGKNTRAKILKCEDEDEDDSTHGTSAFTNKFFFPGATLSGTVSASSQRIYAFGQKLIQDGILTPAAFPNWNGAAGTWTDWVKGQNSPNFLLGNQFPAPDMSGYPHH